jgi:hypothetical protein
MKTFQLNTHVMPWEVDYCLLLFNTLSTAKMRTSNFFKIDIALNISDYHIDWNSSKLDKEYFIEKMEFYKRLLDVFDEVNFHIYSGKENQGHLDLQKAVVRPENDYYICICPDQIFDKSILNIFEQSVNEIEEKYFIITPEIPKFWDVSWDIISNDHFNYLPKKSDGYSYEFLSINRYEALDIINNNPIQLEKLTDFKFAGWLDLYSKDLYEKLVPVPKDWVGYGQWDLYAMLVLKNISLTNLPISVSQYKLKNLITTSLEYSNWNYGENRTVYKNRLNINTVPDQREYYKNVISDCVRSQLMSISKGNA